MKADLSRSEGAFRDDRLFFIGCDDRYAPDQYFSFFRIPRIKMKVFPASDDLSHAKYVVEKMKDVLCECEKDDEIWILLDTDHCVKDGHFHSYELAISEARQCGMNIAISRPCFEVWLACHHWDLEELERGGVCSARGVNDKMKEAFGYDKTKLNAKDFPVQSLPEAYRRAKKRDSAVMGGDKPDGVTTRVYRLWRNILVKASLSQLPEPLNRLAEEIRNAEPRNTQNTRKGEELEE